VGTVVELGGLNVQLIEAETTCLLESSKLALSQSLGLAVRRFGGRRSRRADALVAEGRFCDSWILESAALGGWFLLDDFKTGGAGLRKGSIRLSLDDFQAFKLGLGSRGSWIKVEDRGGLGLAVGGTTFLDRTAGVLANASVYRDFASRLSGCHCDW
jgi:hypothetical protein